MRLRATLRIPAPALEVTENNPVCSLRRRQLEVAAAHWPRSPPAVLDQPLLPHALHRAAAECGGNAVSADTDCRGSGAVEAARHDGRSPPTRETESAQRDARAVANR